MVRKISGKGNQNAVRHLSLNNCLITELKDISNTLAKTFSDNSSTNNYTSEFQQFKKIREQNSINFKSSNLEPYNVLFSMRELNDALRSAHDSSPGPDNIHYQFLKHLPDNSLMLLLDIINQIWVSGILS